jgi:hypothetical protein
MCSDQYRRAVLLLRSFEKGSNLVVIADEVQGNLAIFKPEENAQL